MCLPPARPAALATIDFVTGMKGRMTAEGSARYAARQPEAGRLGFYRTAQGLRVSSLGLGTYLGATSEEASLAYQHAMIEAWRGGINVFDTAINYRGQASERDLGGALLALAEAGTMARDEVLLCSKAGFLTPGAAPVEALRDGDVVGGMHSMAPEFLEDQISRSLANLGLETLDVFYLHNPETQLRFVSGQEFERRLAAAFQCCERMCRQGRIAHYGVATWNGLRLKPGQPERLSLPRLLELARLAGGEEHHFRFVQLPLNLGMPEAFTLPHDQEKGEGANVLECAVRAGVTVMASAPMLQGRLTAGLPKQVRAKWPHLPSDALFSLEFARSTPGVSVTLAGMGRAEHVCENLALKQWRPVDDERYLRLFERED